MVSGHLGLCLVEESVEKIAAAPSHSFSLHTARKGPTRRLRDVFEGRSGEGKVSIESALEGAPHVEPNGVNDGTDLKIAAFHVEPPLGWIASRNPTSGENG
jgi:hypothetical protein